MNEPEVMVEKSETEGEQVKQLRKDKIMASREERLAKIMSLASGRTVDPKEIKLDKTPSPSNSERAAAGVGTLDKLTPEGPISTSSLSSIQTPSTSILRDKITPSPPRYRHLLVIALTGLLFSLWQIFVNKRQLIPFLMPYSSPWHILISSFLAVEVLEVLTRRVQLKNVLEDISLFLFIIILFLKFYE